MAKPRVRLRPSDAPLPADALVIHLVDGGDAATPLRPVNVALERGEPPAELLFDRPPRYPFFDAARELIRRGYEPGRMLCLSDQAGRRCLTARLGYAAQWTVSEGDKHGPTLRRFEETPFGKKDEEIGNGS